MLFYYVITNRIYLIYDILLYSVSQHIKLWMMLFINVVKFQINENQTGCRL